MAYLVQFQINVFALVILVILYAMIRFRLRVKSYGKLLLRWIMVLTAVAVVLEPLTWIFDGMLFPFSYFLEYSTNVLLFLVGPVLGGMLLSYVDYHVFHDPKRLSKRGYYQHLSVLTAIILVVNFFNPIYFEIDPIRNSFSSGALKDVHYLVLASLYIYMLVFLYRNRRRISQSAMMIFIWFFMLPIIGMIVQLFNSRLHFSWTAVVLGVLVAYIFLESTASEQDYLTKLYNRQSYEMYIDHLIETDQPFTFLLFDLNHFKKINDTFGHQIGDKTLIYFGRTLKKVFTNQGFISRLGGDEFVVLVEGVLDETAAINQVNAYLKAANPSYIKNLSFSYGVKQYDQKKSVEAMYSEADKMLYINKRLYHQQFNDNI